MSVAFGFDGFEGIGSVDIILGDVFLRNLHTTYDRENLTATFRQVSLDRWESICFFQIAILASIGRVWSWSLRSHGLYYLHSRNHFLASNCRYYRNCNRRCPVNHNSHHDHLLLLLQLLWMQKEPPSSPSSSGRLCGCWP